MEANVFIPWRGWTAVRELGEGGFGKVYEIQRIKGGVTEKAAMKVITIPKDTSEVEYLKAAGYDEASITNRFDSYKENVLREYGIMAKMKGNTNIVYCDDVEEIRRRDAHGWNIYIKMELLTPLLKSMDSVKEEAQVICLGRDLCGALIACQKQKIIHRDIKPQNVFVSPDGTFKLGDFGIARTLEHTTRATAGIGTYNYMAPEVLHKKKYNQTVDIYSLGLMLYWLLNERRGPFMPLPPAPMTHSAEEQAFQRRMSGEKIPDPKNGSRTLKKIVLKACAFDPLQRYQTAEAMLRDLNSLSGGGNTYGGGTVGDATNYGDTVLDDDDQQGSNSYRNVGVGRVEIFKDPPKVDRKPPKEDRKPPVAGKKKKKTGFIWLILLVMGAGLILLNSPELQDKLGIHLTTSDAKKTDVVLSADAALSYEGAEGQSLSTVLEDGIRERLHYADGSCMDLYYDEYDRERIRVFYDVDGSVTFHFEAEYNADGDMLVYRMFEGKKLVETTRWIYNSAGKEESWQTTDGSGMLKEYAVFTYDEAGQLLRVEGRDDSDAITFVTEYTYSPDGKGKTVVRTEADGTSALWNYDEKDQPIEYRSFDEAGNQQNRTEFAYNFEGQRVAVVEYDAQEIEVYREAKTYNAQGLLQKSVMTWSDGSTSEYTYSYNSRGVETERHGRYGYTDDGETTYDLSTYQWAEDMRGRILRSVTKGTLGEMQIGYYNIYGRQTSYLSFNKKGDLTYRNDYELDENGEILEIRSISYYDDGGKRESVQDADYNELSYVEYDTEGKRKQWMTSELDDWGRLSVQETFREDGTLERYAKYKYLEDGTLDVITETYFSNYDNSTTEYLYDANRKIQYSSTMDETGVTSESYYTYNEMGELESYKDIVYYSDGRYSVTVSNGDYCNVEKKVYDSSDILLSKTEYDTEGRSSKEIFYDAYGNVTSWKEHVRNAQGELEEIITHEN